MASLTIASEWIEPQSPRQTQATGRERRQRARSSAPSVSSAIRSAMGSGPKRSISSGRAERFRGTCGDLAQRCGERLAVRLEPAVAAIERRGVRLRTVRDINHGAVHEPGVRVVHEHEVAAPAAADRRQPHRHRLHVRAAPALAAARHDVCVGGGVQRRHLGGAHEPVDEHDRRGRPCPEKVGDAVGERPRAVVEREALEHEADVVVGVECVRPGGEQDVASLAVGEIEVGEEREAARAGDVERLCARRVVQLEVDRLREDVQLRAGKPAAPERVEVEVARDPDLVHLHEPREEHRRDAVGLEHRARDGRAALGERLPGAGNEVGDEDELSLRHRAGAGAVDRRRVRRGQAGIGSEPRSLARRDRVAAALERKHERTALVRVPRWLPERTVPEELELARHRLR